VFFKYSVIVMYNTISKEIVPMLNTLKRARRPQADGRIVKYSALFMVCALMSAVGGGVWGALAFMPAAIAVEIVSCTSASVSDEDPSQSSV